MNLAALLDGAPDVAVWFDGASTSRAALLSVTVEVEPGRAVGVMLPNGPELIATLFAVWRAGAVYVPFNPRSPEAEAGARMAAVRPAALVTVDGVARYEDATVYDADVALVQFTSGTTGPPKPVPLRHGPVLDLLDRVVGSLGGGGGVRKDGRPPMPNLVPVSLSLWAGIYQVLFAFRVGAPVVVMDRFTTAEFARLVREHGIRSTVLPPAAMTMLTDDPTIDSLGPLRMIRSISAPLSPVQARRFRDRFGVLVLNSYGQTELGGEVVGWTAADTREHGDAKLGSVGRAHAGVEVRVAPDGELLVRTPATASSELVDRVVDDGWFRTGDLGHVDGDGFVWVEGRVSDMINRGGLKVFPAEVEEVLLSVPGVVDAAVVGIADDRLGELPWAFVVGGSAPALDSACRARLAPYKVPVRYIAVDEIPRNEAGKVVRARLLAGPG